MKVYNAVLSYNGHSVGLCVSEFGYGWEDPSSLSATRQREVYHSDLPIQQSEINMAGQCYSEDEYEALGQFIRTWHLYATSRTKPSMLSLKSRTFNGANIPEFEFNYLVIPKSIAAGAKKAEFAPTWQMTMMIARDMLDTGAVPYSRRGAGSKWWWEKGYKGVLESVTIPDDVYGMTDPDDAFVPIEGAVPYSEEAGKAFWDGDFFPSTVTPPSENETARKLAGGTGLR